MWSSGLSVSRGSRRIRSESPRPRKVGGWLTQARSAGSASPTAPPGSAGRGGEEQEERRGEQQSHLLSVPRGERSEGGKEGGWGKYIKFV